MQGYETQLRGGAHWSLLMRRHQALLLTDLEGGANIGMLFHNPENLLERYNAPDTLKCQHTLKLTRGHCLYSDMGRIFAGITEDTLGWHDTIGGTDTPAQSRARWGETSYQTDRNARIVSGQDSFLIEAAKYGLGKRDLAANLNLFSKVAIAKDGTTSFVSNHSPAGAHVTLRFEMDTLVLLHTCPHPMDPSPSYPRKPVLIALTAAEPGNDADPCRLSRPENGRGFANNAIYHLGCVH